MGKITDISKQKRNASRVSIYIDGEFVCGLDAVTAVASRLHIGDEISVDELKSISHKSEVNSAFERSVGYLAVPHTRLEIKRYLRDKGYDADVADECIKRLDEYRYIDDRAYAETYIRSKSNKYGNFRIAAELRKKGVDPVIVDELLEDGNEEAVKTAQKYMRSHRGADVNKLKRFLAGRGYSWDAISRAISDISGEFFSDSGDDDEYFDLDE